MNHLQALSEYKRRMNAMTASQRKGVEKLMRDMMRSGIKLTVWDLLVMAEEVSA